ncbi:MAG: hypothetical protein EBW42_03410 [Rhodobacterales bacterium]|nr:hypothetical protein [Rhodobacterales bacterium]
MAISDTQKVDLLWKKVGFSKAKSDTNANKKAPNEAIVSDLIIKPAEVWSDVGSIPSTIPSSNTTVLRIYTELETTEDATATNNRTWKTGTTNWVPPKFGATYQLKVYVDSAGSGNPASNGTQLFETGSGNNDEWYFDYQSGTLNFIGSNLPSGVSDGNSIFVSGARYQGNTFATGIKDVTLYNATIDSLASPLKTSDGGTGLNTFTDKGVFYASNTSTMAQVTGSNGQVLQISSGEPNFDDLDGGTF